MPSDQNRIPFRVRPMLATLVQKPFHKPGWIYEEKYDGYRILAYKEGDRVTLSIPFDAPAPERRVLHVDRHHVASRGRHPGIRQGGKCDIQIRHCRHLAVLRRVERAFQIIDLRADVQASAQHCGGISRRQSAERRQRA